MKQVAEVSMPAPGFERIVPEGTELERIAQGDGLIFTEGPVWDPVRGALFFVDTRGDRLYSWTLERGVETVFTPTAQANGLSLDLQNRFVLAGWGGRTVWRIEHDGSTTVLASRWDGQKLGSPNDVVVKSDGTVWFTDGTGGLFIPGMCTDDVQRYLEFDGVYRVNSDGSDMTLIGDDFQGPNGLCFSPDESKLYVNETAARRIRVWDVASDNSLSNERHFYTDPVHERIFDGMKVDVEGNVYVTGSEGLHVVNPEGQLLGRIHVPDAVANHCWGDADWRTLYLTCREVLYRIRLGIPGVPHGEANRQQVLAAVSGA